MRPARPTSGPGQWILICNVLLSFKRGAAIVVHGTYVKSERGSVGRWDFLMMKPPNQ